MNSPVLPIHPHNAFLLVWVELGLVGVAFGCDRPDGPARDPRSATASL